MQLVLPKVGGPARLVLESDSRLSNREYFDFCMANPNLRIERTAEGKLEIMAPTGFATSYRNSEVTAQLRNWAEENGIGVALDSNAEFFLPNGAARSPDACWVKKSRLKKFTAREKEGFLPLCPDFVVELKSPSDRLKRLQLKMEEWMANGAQLGWLIDPSRETVYVYRQQAAMEKISGLTSIGGEGPVEGFLLDLTKVWAAT